MTVKLRKRIHHSHITPYSCIISAYLAIFVDIRVNMAKITPWGFNESTIAKCVLSDMGEQVRRDVAVYYFSSHTVSHSCVDVGVVAAGDARGARCLGLLWCAGGVHR